MEASPGGSQAQTWTYNTLIKGLGRELLIDEAFEVARGMVDRGCYPDEVSNCQHPFSGYFKKRWSMDGLTGIHEEIRCALATITLPTRLETNGTLAEVKSGMGGNKEGRKQ